MKCWSCLISSCLISVFLFTVTAVAQPPAAGQKRGIAASLQLGYNNIKMNLTQGAEKMPEADYGFKPVPEVRTFGQIIGHVANSQFFTCASLKGVPNPNQGINLEQKTAKSELVKALADSFALCDDAFSGLTDANATDFVKQGPNEVARAGVLGNVLTHDNETYGTAVVYLRLKGIVPPSTERAMQGRGRGGH